MKQIINTDEDKCRGCFKCVGVCPVGEANIISVDNGVQKIRIDSQKCIACGACLRACPYNARYYNDDTELFFDDLEKGEPIALIVAPAFITNFSNWKGILAWLKTRGVSTTVNVSLGIKICTWAHLRFIERNNQAALITQPCPPIVRYIEKYCPELLDKLSPVLSPILCTAVYLKKTLKLPEKIAALTPCPAKADEFKKSNSVSYNVTFQRLADYLKAYGISIPEDDFEFDDITVASGQAHMTLVGRPETTMRLMGCIGFIDSRIKLENTKSQSDVYNYLDLVTREKNMSFPVLLDALNCIGGCSNGVGGRSKKPDSHYMIDIHNVDAEISDSEQMYLFAIFDYILELNDYFPSHSFEECF